MKDLIIAWFCKPENLILLGVGLIQVWKLVRGYMPETWAANATKVTEFLSWAIPSAYNVIESLEEKGLIDKNCKFSKFMDLLMDAAKKQEISLSTADIAKAKLVVEGISQASKGPLPVSPVSVLPSGQR